MNVGESPSLFCAYDRHDECAERKLENCTCKCHRLPGTPACPWTPSEEVEE